MTPSMGDVTTSLHSTVASAFQLQHWLSPYLPRYGSDNQNATVYAEVVFSSEVDLR
jgi:hypothetical protein